MKRFPYIWLVPILAGAFALRLFRLGVNSLWYDETVSVYLARQDLVSLTRHTAGDIHPPLYYYLLHFWGGLAGWSEFSVAFLSLFFGVLLIALVYRVGREWFSRNVAVLAAFLVAFSPYNLWYSQEVRMYALGAVLGLVSTFYFIRLLNPTLPKSRGNFIAYAFASTLGLYTLYFFAFLLVTQNLAALVYVLRDIRSGIRSSEKIKTWFWSQAAVLILYLPWLPIALRQATNPPVNPWRSFTDWTGVLTESFSALALGQSLEPMNALPALVLLAVVIGIGLFARRAQGLQNPRVSGGFLLAYTFVPVLLIYALSLWAPLYHVRYVYTYSPGFYLLLALGLETLRRSRPVRFARVLAGGSLIVLLVFSGYSAYNFWFSPRYADDDLRGAFQSLAAGWRPGDAILLDAGYTYTAFDYYYDQPVTWRGRLTGYTAREASAGAVVLQTGSIGGAASLGWGDPESDFYATTAGETRAALDRVLAAHPRVWLVRLYDTVVDPDGIIRDYLATHAQILDDEGFAGESFARVQVYQTARGAISAMPASATPCRADLRGYVTLSGYEPASVTLDSGMPLDLNLYWQAQEPTNVDDHLFVGLYSQRGPLVAFTDEIPLGNGWGTSRWSPGQVLREPVRLFLPAGLEQDDYILRVSLYNPLTREPLGVLKSECGTVEEQITLTTVHITKAGGQNANR